MSLTPITYELVLEPTMSAEAVAERTGTEPPYVEYMRFEASPNIRTVVTAHDCLVTAMLGQTRSYARAINGLDWEGTAGEQLGLEMLDPEELVQHINLREARRTSLIERGVEIDAHITPSVFSNMRRLPLEARAGQIAFLDAIKAQELEKGPEAQVRLSGLDFNSATDSLPYLARLRDGLVLLSKYRDPINFDPSAPGSPKDIFSAAYLESTWGLPMFVTNPRKVARLGRALVGLVKARACEYSALADLSERYYPAQTV